MKKHMLLLQLCTLIPGISHAHPPTGSLDLAMLYTNEMLAAQEKVCTARAPAEGKQFSLALAKWRTINAQLLSDLEEAAQAAEKSAYQKLGDPADNKAIQAGLSELLSLTTLKTWGASTVWRSFAAVNDAQAKDMCLSYVHEVKDDTWLRKEMQTALKRATSQS